MSSKENDHIEDAELRDLLRTLPQAGPSAELDAAILAAAEKALYLEAALDADTDGRVGKSRVFRKLAEEAANDAAIPQPAPPARPSFLSRWKVPLAFAASVLVTVNMIGPQWFTSSPEEFPTTVAPLPAAAPQPQAQPAEAPPPQAESAAVAASAAPAPAPAPAPAARSAARAPVVRQRAAPEPSPAAAPLADAVREQPMATMRPEMAESASGKIAPAPAPAKPQPMSAPVAQARQAPAGKMAFSTAAPAPVVAPSEAGDAAPKEPQAWLLHIERMLKADRSKEAVEEWVKFRRAYPDYPVPQELAERIYALKK